MTTTRKRRTGKGTTPDATAEPTKKKGRKAAEPPRDLQTEDNGVPRGDWSDDPLKPDDGGEGIRSNFDGHYRGDAEDRSGSDEEEDR